MFDNSPKCRRSLCLLALSTTLLWAAPWSFANDQEQFIPDDTHFYLGTDRRVPIADLFKLAPNFAVSSSRQDKHSRGVEVLEQLGEFYKHPETLFANWGIAEDLQFSGYTVGLAPTFRVAVADHKKFHSALVAFETKHDLTATVTKRENVTARVYTIESLKKTLVDKKQESDAETSAARNTDDSEERDPEEGNAGKTKDAKTQAAEKLSAGLLIATDENDIIVSLLLDTSDLKAMDAVTGVSKPTRSIAQSGELKQLRKKWGYNDEPAGFIDIEQIAQTMTGTESGSSLQLEKIADVDPVLGARLDNIRNETCRTEISKFAESWPMLVSGYRVFEVSEDDVEFGAHAAAVLKHELLRDTLKLFSGTVPASQSSSRPMLSLGVGITVDLLAQAVGQISQLLSSINYRCSVLAPMNRFAHADLSSASMGVVMFGGLARGVRGLSVNMFDLDIDRDNASGPVQNVDSAVAISVEDPALLLQTLKMMPQLGMLAELPLDGSEVSLNSMLPVPLPDGMELKGAVKGKNIVLFSGEKGTDFASRLASSETESFFRSTVDTGLIFDKIESVLELVGKNVEEASDVLSLLKSYPRGVANYSIDFTDEGIELESGGVFAVEKSE